MSSDENDDVVFDEEDDDEEEDEDDDEEPVEQEVIAEESDEDDSVDDDDFQPGDEEEEVGSAPGVRVAGSETDDDDDEEDDGEDYEEEEEDEVGSDDSMMKELETRASALVYDGQLEQAIPVLCELTSHLAGELADLDDEELESGPGEADQERRIAACRSSVLGVLGLWSEVMRERGVVQKYQQSKGSASTTLVDSLGSWLNLFLSNELIDLTTVGDDDEEEEEEEMEVIKEFSQLLDDLKAPAKKKQKV